MPEKKQKLSALPAELPMPKYRYQQTVAGSVSVKYDEKTGREARDKLPSLHNLRWG